MTRVDVKAILRDRKLREKMMVSSIQALQHRAGIYSTRGQILKAYRNAKRK